MNLEMNVSKYSMDDLGYSIFRVAESPHRFWTQQALLFRTTGQRSQKDGADLVEVETGRSWDDHHGVSSR